MPQGVGLAGTMGGWGVKKKFYRNSTRFGVLVTNINGTCNQFFWSQPLGALGRGPKVKYHKISITKSISKIFKPNFVCLLTNERYKKYPTGFSFHRLGHAPGVGLWGIVRGWRVTFPPKNFSPQIQPDLVCELLT